MRPPQNSSQIYAYEWAMRRGNSAGRSLPTIIGLYELLSSSFPPLTLLSVTHHFLFDAGSVQHCLSIFLYDNQNENVTNRPCRQCVTMQCRCLHARAPVAAPRTCSEHLQRRLPRCHLQSRGDDDLISMTLPLPSVVNKSIRVIL